MQSKLSLFTLSSKNLFFSISCSVCTFLLFSISCTYTVISVFVSRMLTMPLWPGWTWRDALRACRRRLPSSRRSMKRSVDMSLNYVCLLSATGHLQFSFVLCMSVGCSVLYHITTLCEATLPH